MTQISVLEQHDGSERRDGARNEWQKEELGVRVMCKFDFSSVTEIDRGAEEVDFVASFSAILVMVEVVEAEEVCGRAGVIDA